jgi:hypothetical protein
MHDLGTGESDCQAREFQRLLAIFGVIAIQSQTRYVYAIGFCTPSCSLNALPHHSETEGPYLASQLNSGNLHSLSPATLQRPLHSLLSLLCTVGSLSSQSSTREHLFLERDLLRISHRNRRSSSISPLTHVRVSWKMSIAQYR